MKQVDFYCNRCKCSMKVSYTLSGDPDALVLHRGDGSDR